MKVKRIHIVGIYGSGKSTLANKLQKILKYPVYDLDDIKYKRKFDKIRPLRDRLKIINDISRRNTWITEGAWLDYAINLYKKADLIIFLEIPESKLYFRIFLRHFKRKFDRKEYNNHNLKTTFNIMKKVRQYFHDPTHFMTLKSHRDYINKYAKKIVVIKNNKDIAQLIEKIT